MPEPRGGKSLCSDIPMAVQSLLQLRLCVLTELIAAARRQREIIEIDLSDKVWQVRLRARERCLVTARYT